MIDIYRPNRIIELAKLGVRSLPQSSAFLFCSACTLCTKHCPQGVKVHELMQGLKELAENDPTVWNFAAENIDSILEELGAEMPFPVTYSWICLNPKNAASPLQDSIAKAFDRALNTPKAKQTPPADAKRVAVIGSGPAGLTAAWELARRGLAVTVFESGQALGGMLSTGIPSHRLPQNVVDAEIDAIRALGVRMETNTAVGPELFEKLLTEYAAVFIATGASASRALRMEGEDLQGVVPALQFLKEYNAAPSDLTGVRVVVVGGGNVATDAADAAKRSGASTVHLFCLESRETMPAHEWEIDEIIRDGVEVNAAWGPKTILGDGQRVTGMEFVLCKSVTDASGRFNPVFDERKTKSLDADMVITAIGQGPDLRFLSGDIERFRGAVQVDPYTMETNIPGVYAGGDATSGTASLVEALAAGKLAAASIARYLEEQP
ncbi:MAG: FAD-dependent oxidoreductase [Clostridiales bacterium]|nr:FAD-dependent oxidoreductase [Clostridiales bacterium]